MIVIGIDPGPENSAYVIFNGKAITFHDIVDNETMLTRISELNELDKSDDHYRVLVVEQVSMGGMIAGPSVFETCYWAGRFVERWFPKTFGRVKRTEVKYHICHTHRANDSVIREVLIQRFGPGTEKAIGRKKEPGPLYGLASHKWAAFAVALTWFDQHGHEQPDLRPGVKPQWDAPPAPRKPDF